MQPQLLLKNHGRTAEPTSCICGFGTLRKGRRKKTSHEQTGETHSNLLQERDGEIFLKRIGTVNGMKLYDAICTRENILLAVKNACRDHARDPQVIAMKEHPEEYVQAV